MVAKISGSQQPFLAEIRQPFELSNGGRKGYCFVLTAIMHRKSHTCHFFCFLFFLPYLQDHSFMRSRNFSPLSA